MKSPMMPKHMWILGALVVLITGCGDSFDRHNPGLADTSAQADGQVVEGDIAAGDAPQADGGPTDAGDTEDDAGSAGDSGAETADDAAGTDAAGDATATDAGIADAGGQDAGPDDAGSDDAGSDDAGSDDAGTSDAGNADAGGSDAGPLPCATTSTELCDGIDNDCDGKTDEATCDDGNPCTDDTCAAAKGCVHTNNSATCDDGNLCTSKDACGAGTCAGVAKLCDDGNSCTTSVCNKADGACLMLLHKAGSACSDSNACTAFDSCDGTTCKGVDMVCDDGKACTIDSCDAKTGACKATAIVDGAACDDGSACTQGDTCTAGSCGGKALANGSPCGDAATQCSTGDVCKAGACIIGTTKADGAQCSDDNPCTSNDACKGGSCKASVAPDVCDDGSPCSKGTCVKLNVAQAKCVFAPANEGKACTDGNACTSGDACKSGSCQSAKDNCTYQDVLDDKYACSSVKGWTFAPVGAEPQVGWHIDGTPAKPGYKSATCSLNMNNGVSYNNGKRVIASATTKTISVANVAHASLSLWSFHGVQAVPGVDVRQVQISDDGFKKHVERFYFNNLEAHMVWQKLELPIGSWVGKTIQIRFVFDSIDEKSNDGPGWFIDDVVLTEGALPKKCTDVADCEDGDLCTKGSCDLFDGTCSQTAVTDGTICQDGDNCTGGGLCASGSCVAKPFCDDDESCTKDLCNAFNGECIFESVAAKTVCDDANACTNATSCNEVGMCTGGVLKDCDDSDLCTADACDPQIGCYHAFVAAPCEDGNACTQQDNCDAKGSCKPGTAVDCDDKDACTTDSCTAATGKCDHVSLPGCGATCTDAASCTDGNTCTMDACDAKTGTCSHLPEKDDVICSVGKICKLGTCVGTTGGWAQAIASGGGASSFCAVLTNGAAACWGRNHRGQIGNGKGGGGGKGADDIQPTPAVVQGLTDVTAISVGSNHACAVHGIGLVSCWGSNSAGQLGFPASAKAVLKPVQITSLPPITHIAAADLHTCAVTAAGKAYCWGAGANGRLGNGSTSNSSKPVLVAGVDKVVAIAAGAAHTCVATTDKKLRCWGANDYNQASDKAKDVLKAEAYKGFTNVVSVTAGTLYTCAIGKNGVTRCVGRNLYGNFGNGKITLAATSDPAVVAGKHQFTQVEAGWTHTVGLDQAGAAWAWGLNSSGQLGSSGQKSLLSPVKMTTTGAAKDIATARTTSCLLLTTGSVQCTGDNTWGALGSGKSGAATSVSSLQNVVQ